MGQVTASAAVAWSKESAYRYCRGLARTHYENFTVGSWLLPREKLEHVYAIYGFCRFVDDLGDEARTPSYQPSGTATVPSPLGRSVGRDFYASGQSSTTREGEVRQVRLALLDQWQAELEACYSGSPSHPIMVALRHTINAFEIPRGPFIKLIEANRIDQGRRGHPTYGDLLYYCDHSANPVGHLFLYLFGYRDAERQRLANYTCTALQLANFWQDVARDYRKGRIYLPLEDMARFSYTEAELAQGLVNDQFRQLMAFEVDRARELFEQGAPLVETLDGPVKLDVALFTRGGVAVLRAIQRQGYDVLTSRPSLSRAKKARLLGSAWLGWKLGRPLLPPPLAEHSSSHGGLP